MSTSTVYELTSVQKFFFAILRMAIGWHFLREGYVKLSQTDWSAYGYLANSWGPFAPYFKQMAEDPQMLQLANTGMPWALTLVGLGLMFGVFTRLSCLGGIVLLASFYLSAPPWGEPQIPLPFVQDTEFSWGYYEMMLSNATWAGNIMIGSEGNYQIVNKNLLELLALVALLTTNSGKFCGFDGLIGYYIFGFGRSKQAKEQSSETDSTPELQPATE